MLAVMEVLDPVAVTFDGDALAARLHLAPGSDDAAQFAALLERARLRARPKALYTEAGVTERGEDWVCLHGVRFTSRVLARNLDGVHRVFPYVVTCGAELDGVALPDSGLLSRFWLDTIKEAALQAAAEELSRHITDRFQPGTIASMNPGASGTDVWRIEDQRPLFALLGDVQSLIGVTLSESCLMWPNKSLSGLFFPTEMGFENCAVCSRGSCEGRRAPYDADLAARLLGGHKERAGADLHGSV